MKLDLASILNRKRKQPKRTREQMRELGARGGRASAEARRQRKLEAELAKLQRADDIELPPRVTQADVIAFAYATGSARALGLPTTAEELAELLSTEGANSDPESKNHAPVAQSDGTGSARDPDPPSSKKGPIRPTRPSSSYE